MKITVQDFVQEFKNKKIINTKVAPNAVSEYIRANLEIQHYIPFDTKRKLVEIIVEQFTEVVDGVKKYDTISAYIGFVTTMISAHTSLAFGDNPIEDYDLLSESGLLLYIVDEFRQSYDECDAILKMTVSMELEDNNIGALVGRFLDDILKRFDAISSKIKDIDFNKILGEDIKQEDLAKVLGFLNKLK